MKKGLVILLAVLTVLSTLTFAPISAQAKTGATTKKPVALKDNKTYSNYDITGDGKADKIRVKYYTYVYSESGCGEAIVYVNKKKIRKFQGGAAVEVKLVAPKKNCSFLIVSMSYKGGGSDSGAYRYVRGKFKKANSGNLYKPLTYGKVTKNTKDKVYFKINTGKYERYLFEDYWGDTVGFTAIYKVKNKKLVLKSKTFKAGSNRFKANQYFSLSSVPSYNDYDGPYVSRNDTVKFVALRLVKDDYGYPAPSYKISVDGETGWLTPDTYADSDDVFFKPA